jgi:type II secretion system protein G
MNRFSYRTSVRMILSLITTGTAVGGDLSKMFPAETLVYANWPGQQRLSETWKDTTFNQLMSEPEMVRLRKAWGNDVWPAIRELIHREAMTESDAAAFDAGSTLLTAAWRYPCAVGLIGVGIGEAGPAVDLACVIRAGDDADELSKMVNDLMARLRPNGDISVRDVECHGSMLRELVPQENEPPIPVRWGVIDGDVVWTLGTRFCDHLAAGANADNLSKSEEFLKACKRTGASSDTPTLFVNVDAAITKLKSFQMLFAASGVPVLGEENGVQNLLDGLGLGSLRSLTITMAPAGEGIQATTFLHAPNLQTGLGSLLVQQPLTSNDLAVVPRNVNWATVANFDLKDAYNQLLSSLQVVAPNAAMVVTGATGMFEGMTKISLVNDVFGAFKDTWAIYDAPDNGGLWFLGVTLVAEVQRDNRLTELIAKSLALIPRDEDVQVSLQQETYRETTIHYVNVSGIPLPLAPAWAQIDDRFVLALYPQVVRAALDHLLDRGESITANGDFQRGFKRMPEKPHSINYVDTKAGVSQMYPLVLLIADALGAMAQSEGIPVRPTLMPSLPTLRKHLFGNVSASAMTPDGLLTVSYGASPIAIPAIGEGGMMVPAMVSILLPSLARARELAKRSVSASNLASIARACLLHAETHKGVLPPDLDTLVNEGSIASKTLIAPQDDPGTESSYVYVKGQNITMDPRNVLIHERPNLNDAEGVNVAFLDGHVKWMTMSEFEERLAETIQRLADLGVDAERKESRRFGGQGTRKAEIKATQALVGPRGALASALDLFQLSMDRYPKELKELVERPDDDKDDKWAGPYVRSMDSLKDAWGHKLRYRYPGCVNKDRYDLWSVGPDGQDGTNDDIANWKMAH